MRVIRDFGFITLRPESNNMFVRLGLRDDSLGCRVNSQFLKMGRKLSVSSFSIKPQLSGHSIAAPVLQPYLTAFHDLNPPDSFMLPWPCCGFFLMENSFKPTFTCYFFHEVFPTSQV